MIGLSYVLALSAAAMLLACLRLISLEMALRICQELIFFYLFVKFLQASSKLVFASGRKKKRRAGQLRRRKKR